MKKIVGSIIGVLIICIACVYFMRPIIADIIREYRYEGSLIYYTQILKSGIVEKDGKDYQYDGIGVDENGQSKNISFYGMDGKELKTYAYLKINYTPREGVLGWENIKEDEIPEPVLNRLKEISNDAEVSPE